MHRKPCHIGVIPDGNRRWALKKGLEKQEGYARGVEAGGRLLRAAKSAGIEELTFYGFTVDNCKRPQKQVSAFSQACVNAVEIMQGENVSVCVLGNTESPCFPKELLPYTSRAGGEGKMRVNLLVNYGWEWDIKGGWLSRAVPRVDLIIRWGGMRRLSGFLPLQSAYSDICVIDDLWGDFKEEQFYNALDWYSRQDVTLGG